MKAYSQDLRERVVSAIDQGKSQHEVALLFKVSSSTLKRDICGKGVRKGIADQRRLLDALPQNEHHCKLICLLNWRLIRMQPCKNIVRCGKRVGG